MCDAFPAARDRPGLIGHGTEAISAARHGDRQPRPRRRRGRPCGGATAARQALPDAIEVVEHDGEATSLLEWIGDADAAVLIDACASGAPAGTVHRFDAAAGPLPRDRFGLSTHGFGLAEAVELGRALGRLPPACVVYAIEGLSFEAGAPLSPAVAGRRSPRWSTASGASSTSRRAAMHEASLMAGLMRRIEEIAAAEGARRVIVVSVWLGALSHMSAEHFAEHFEHGSQAPSPKGARLEVTTIRRHR